MYSNLHFNLYVQIETETLLLPTQIRTHRCVRVGGFSRAPGAAGGGGPGSACDAVKSQLTSASLALAVSRVQSLCGDGGDTPK